MSIEYGWTRFRFALRDTKLLSRIELEEQNEDGDWIQREANWLAFNEEEERRKEQEFENIRAVRYGVRYRYLLGNAFAQDHRNEIFLGLPEDKNEVFGDERPNKIKCSVREADGNLSDDELKTLIRCGALGYIPPIDHWPESVYLELHVPSHVFDQIEAVADSSCGLVELECNLKCWHWIDPLGQTFIYVDKDEQSHAELSCVSITSYFENAFDPGEYDEEEHLDFPRFRRHRLPS